MFSPYKVCQSLCKGKTFLSFLSLFSSGKNDKISSKLWREKCSYKKMQQKCKSKNAVARTFPLSNKTAALSHSSRTSSLRAADCNANTIPPNSGLFELVPSSSLPTRAHLSAYVTLTQFPPTPACSNSCLPLLCRLVHSCLSPAHVLIIPE
jgi:hypothetical protein